MSTVKSSIVVKELPKSGTLENCNLYIMNAVVFYPVIHEPKDNWDKTGKEFSTTIFVDEETKDKLLDEVMVNKTFAEVGVSKTSKPPRRIKYPLSTQAEEGKVNYDSVDGMWGFNAAKNEYSKAGNLMKVNVIGKDGKAFTDNVGNGSVCNIKLYAYRNRDNQLVISLDTVQVIEHVAYEGSTGSSGVVTDDVFGVSYELQKAVEVQDAPVVPQATQKPVQQQAVEDKFDTLDDDIPFAPIGKQEGKMFLHMI